MNFRLVQYQENIYANFWFYPLALTLAAIGLAMTVEWLDHFYNWPFLIEMHWVYKIGAGGARDILATIATAAITITSVAFSIAVLILSLASQQFGQRLLPNFMRQGRTQFVLGIFLGTFIFCLLELRTIPDIIELNNFPQLTLLVSLILGALSFFTLIYFIHYICHAIQVDNILDYIKRDIEDSISRQLPNREEKKLFLEYFDEPIAWHASENQTQFITADKTGYIQTIDHDAIFSIAEKNDLIIQVLYSPGYHVIADLPIFKYVSNKHLEDGIIDKLRKCITVGIRRSSVQDIVLGFELYVEIAIRALSPAINAPFTAMASLYAAQESLAFLTTRYIPSPYYYDKEKKLRLIQCNISYHKIVSILFQRFRCQKDTDIMIGHTILQIIIDLTYKPLNAAFKDALLQEAILTLEYFRHFYIHTKEMEELTARFEKIKQRLT